MMNASHIRQLLIKEHELFLKEVEAHIKKHKIAETMFGIKAGRSPHFVERLRSGWQPKPETMDKVRAFMGKS
jgi:hypothetical protein